MVLQAKLYDNNVNRLIFPKSPHRREGLAPRCRLVTSCGGSTSQGLGCSPIKVVRELGSERSHTALICSDANLVSAYIDEAFSKNTSFDW